MQHEYDRPSTEEPKERIITSELQEGLDHQPNDPSNTLSDNDTANLKDCTHHGPDVLSLPNHCFAIYDNDVFPDEVLLVQIPVQGVPTTVLIDTGASRSYASHMLAENSEQISPIAIHSSAQRENFRTK